MVWYISYGVLWYKWYGINGMVYMVWYGMVYMVWYGIHGMVYMVWYTWYGRVWYIDVLLKIFFLTLVVDKINVSFYTCT